MRRETLIRACERIIRDIEESQVRSAIEASIDRNSEKKPSLVPFKEYAIRTARYGDAERKVVEIMELGILEDPDFWLTSFQKTDGGPGPAPAMYSAHSAVYRTMNFLPPFLRLLKQERLEAVRNSDPKAPEFLRGKALLTVILPETEEQYSSPARLSSALDSIAAFYHVFAVLNDVSDTDLTVIGCDSGSDKSFDFTGMPQVIQGIKETIIAIWDRVVLHRHQQVRASIETIAQSLPVIERISLMESSGAIPPEQAELLRRKTVQACTKFLDAGAITIDLEANQSFNPRLLMAPEQKLLAAPPSPLHSDQGLSKPASNEAAASQEEDLRTLVEDLKRQVEQQKRQAGSSSVRTKRKRSSTGPKE